MRVNKTTYDTKCDQCGAVKSAPDYNQQRNNHSMATLSLPAGPNDRKYLDFCNTKCLQDWLNAQTK